MPESFRIFACIMSGAFGATVGSFLNVCIWRLPRDGLSVSSPRRSHCGSCGSQIAWYDNIPLLSWLLLGGHCRSCRRPISIRYFLVEGLTALVFALIAYKYLIPGDVRWGEFIALTVLAAALIVASFIDIDLRILPDEITLTGMMAVPFVAIVVPELHTRPVDGFVWGALVELEEPLRRLSATIPAALRGDFAIVLLVTIASIGCGVAGLYGYRLYWRTTHPTEPKRLRDGALAAVIFGSLGGVGTFALLDPAWLLSPRIVSYAGALCGMLVGSGTVLAVGKLGSIVFRKPAMGFGDVKLMGLLGGFTGWVGVFAGFGLACFFGSIVGVWRLARYRTRYLWFGPFLSLGCFLYLLFPGALKRGLEWYMGLIQGLVG